MGGSTDIEPVNTEQTPVTTRRRRKKSIVWEHFTVEAVAGGSKRACCKLCKQSFSYSSGTKIAGTSHLRRHIEHGSCPKIKNQEKKQLSLTTPGSDENIVDPPRRRHRNSWSYTNFDQEISYSNLAKMIIVHEFPLDMVESPAFIAFVQSLQLRFRNLSFGGIEREILSVYHKEKCYLLHILGSIPGRISLTICLWETCQTLGYVCLTGQFIDADWKLHRRMLNFMMVSSPHSENALSEAIGISLLDWNMKHKLFTITLDKDCSSHDIYSANLRDHLINKNALVLKGQLFVVRCYANILNVVATEALAQIHGITFSIRESIKFVKASPAREKRFADISSQLEIPSSKALYLDIPSQWSTTYLMLTTALDYKQVFTCLERDDDKYNEAPTVDDWRTLQVVCNYLKLLYDSANAIMSVADPTANIFFHEVHKIHLELSSARRAEIDISRNDQNEDKIEEIISEMQDKFDKYWKDCSLVLAVAVVMDPRFKLRLVDFSFSKLYGEDAARYVKVVDDAVHELYVEYVRQPLPLTPAYADVEEGNSSNVNTENIGLSTPVSTGDGLLDFDIYISEISVNQHSKSELEQYLEESLVPRIQEFDILSWWKLNTIKFPTLSKMARDVLAIPVSMVGPGFSIFGSGSGSRILDEYRSALSPETVEALFCSKDWLQYMPTMSEPPPSAIVKMEEV